MIKERYELLFILICAFKLVENETQRTRVLNDIRTEVATLEAQGVVTMPKYVSEILTWI